MNHNKLTLIIFFIAYPIYLDISIEEDVNLIAAIVTVCYFPRLDKSIVQTTITMILDLENKDLSRVGILEKESHRVFLSEEEKSLGGTVQIRWTPRPDMIVWSFFLPEK